MVVREGFEPSKLSWQSYSLLPLTAREPHLFSLLLELVAVAILTHFTKPILNKVSKNGAGTRIRTVDLLITSQLLYQLSYAGFFDLNINEYLYDISMTFRIRTVCSLAKLSNDASGFLQDIR